MKCVVIGFDLLHPGSLTLPPRKDGWKIVFVDSRNSLTCTYSCLYGSRKRRASKLYVLGCLTLKIDCSPFEMAYFQGLR